jgi:opacity protein-like surface antigen
MWNRQSTTLAAHHAQSGSETTLTNNAHLDMYQANLLYEFPTSSRIVPFIVGGFGFTYFDSHGVLDFHYRGSYNLGGGVKYMLAPQIAARTELRWSPSRTTSASAVFCDPFLGCFTTPISNHAQQWQANIGLEFRF